MILDQTANFSSTDDTFGSRSGVQGGRLALVTDFDGTLMHQDVGDELMGELGVGREPAAREVAARIANKEVGSRAWIEVGYAFLEGRKDDVDRVIERMHPRDGAAELFALCGEEHIPITILSDGMEYYIRRLTAKFNLKADAIVVNPILYEVDGSYRLGTQNRNAACDWCGCCKAGYVRGLKEQGYRIVYIGDGSSDVYGSAFSDWTFARASLAAHLKREGEPFFPFESLREVLALLHTNIAAFRDGTMPGRRSGVHQFCRF